MKLDVIFKTNKYFFLIIIVTGTWEGLNNKYNYDFLIIIVKGFWEGLNDK